LANADTNVMSRCDDVTASVRAERPAARLGEARAVQRRLDKLAAAAAGEDAIIFSQLKPGMQ
jgi:hypothetical protein